MVLAATLDGRTNDGVLTINSATPQIVGSGKLRTANTSATTITNFLGGIEGMQFSLLIDDANTSITVGPTGNIRDLRLEAVITRLLPRYTLLNFHRIGSAWYTTVDPSLRGSLSFGGTVNAQSTTTITIPVTGAVAGRRAHVAPSASLNGLVMTPVVTTDNVEVTLANVTTSNIALPTRVFRALVTPL